MRLSTASGVAVFVSKPKRLQGHLNFERRFGFVFNLKITIVTMLHLVSLKVVAVTDSSQ